MALSRLEEADFYFRGNDPLGGIQHECRQQEGQAEARAPSLWSKWTGARFRRQWLNRKWLVDLLSVIWPSSMRISDSRRNGGFLQQYQGIAFVACVFLAFMQAGLIIGHTTHESAQVYQTLRLLNNYMILHTNLPLSKQHASR